MVVCWFSSRSGAGDYCCGTAPKKRKMSSSDEDSGSASGVTKEKEDQQAVFVSLLKEYPVLFEKSQTPAVRKLKNEKLEHFKEIYERTFAVPITVSQLIKRINNLRSRLKVKTDTKRTGNRRIILKAWEKELLKLMQGDSNPAINKIPGRYKIYLFF